MERSCAQMELFQNLQKTIKDVQTKDTSSRYCIQVVLIVWLNTRVRNTHHLNGSLTNLPDQDWAYEHSVKLDKKYLISLLRHDELEMDFLADEYQTLHITMNHPGVFNHNSLALIKLLRLCV